MSKFKPGAAIICKNNYDAKELTLNKIYYVVHTLPPTKPVPKRVRDNIFNVLVDLCEGEEVMVKDDTGQNVYYLTSRFSCYTSKKYKKLWL